MSAMEPTTVIQSDSPGITRADTSGNDGAKKDYR
jgi:hypothetical protein